MGSNKALNPFAGSALATASGGTSLVLDVTPTPPPQQLAIGNVQYVVRCPAHGKVGMFNKVEQAAAAASAHIYQQHPALVDQVLDNVAIEITQILAFFTNHAVTYPAPTQSTS